MCNSSAEKAPAQHVTALLKNPLPCTPPPDKAPKLMSGDGKGEGGLTSYISPPTSCCVHIPRHEAKNPTIHPTLLAKLRDGGGEAGLYQI